MPVKGFRNRPIQNGVDDAISAAADFPGVRMFNMPKKQSFHLQEECGGRWMSTGNLEDVLEFSATAFYFATNLNRALHIPVGIVNCSYGGTKVESWLPREILERYPDVLTDSAAIYKITKSLTAR